MSTTIVPPTPSVIIEPTISDLRKMLSDEAAPAAAEATTEKPSEAPAAEKTAAAETEKTPAESETAPTTEPEKPRESAIDRRFSKLAHDRDAAREEAAQLRRELEAAKTPQPGPAAKPAEAKPDASRPLPPDPSKWTGTWEELEAAKLEYFDKLSDWKTSEALKARDVAAQQKQFEAEQKTLHGKWEERTKAAYAKHPDFQEAIEEIGPFVTAAGVANLIKQSDIGPEIVMYLHQHPEETAEIARLGDSLLVAREIGRLETRLTAPQPKTPAAKALPKPPASIDTTGAPSAIDLNTADMRTFRREVGRLTSRD